MRNNLNPAQIVANTAFIVKRSQFLSCVQDRLLVWPSGEHMKGKCAHRGASPLTCRSSENITSICLERRVALMLHCYTPGGIGRNRVAENWRSRKKSGFRQTLPNAPLSRMRILCGTATARDAPHFHSPPVRGRMKANRTPCHMVPDSSAVLPLLSYWFE